MKVLIVGAGAVGLVYARHLQRGGAEVSFYVREQYRAEVQAGATLLPLNEGKASVRLEGLAALCTLDEVRAVSWDQVWLCIPSTGLRGDWLAPFLDAVGPALVVSFQPGLRDGELLRAQVPAERLAKGIITFSSWHSPLPGQGDAPAGTAYWFPPLSPGLFEGPQAAEIAATLRAGGCPARVGQAGAATAKGSAFLLPVVAAMECAGWTFAGLRTSRWSTLAADASREALAITCAHEGLSAGPQGLVTRGLVVQVASHVAPWVAPFDLERFLQAHFTKVGAQTTLALESWIAAGAERGLPTGQLQELARALAQARGAAA